ncbi:hypothetical protein Mapa_012791 [Marchantia paleacea]|nr:hypothetical protein Mapa_012791 [Marchantia paleacea]
MYMLPAQIIVNLVKFFFVEVGGRRRRKKYIHFEVDEARLCISPGSRRRVIEIIGRKNVEASPVS